MAREETRNSKMSKRTKRKTTFHRGTGGGSDPDRPPFTEGLEGRVLLSAGGSQSQFGRLAAGDFNGDTRPDLVVAASNRGNGGGSGSNNGPVLLLDAGNGTYAAPIAITVPAGAGGSVRAADFN